MSETEVYRDSLVNWLRFNHKDLFNLVCFVGVCAVLLGLAWLGDTLANHLLVNHVTSCGTVGCHPTTGTVPDPHIKGFPTYTPTT